MKNTFIVLHCNDTHQEVYIDASKIMAVYYDSTSECTNVDGEFDFSFTVDETPDEVYEKIRTRFLQA